MALGDYVKGVPKPTSYSQLVNSPVPSSGTPLRAPAPAPYVAPAPAPAINYNQPAYIGSGYGPAQVKQNYYGGGGATGATAQAAAPVAPPAPPKPPINYEEVYNTDDKVAGVDSTFNEQRAMFKNALDKYLLEDQRQVKDVNRDATTALEGIGRNEVNGLTSMNEDFAARGLGRSGMRLGAIGEATDQYGRQKTNVREGLTKSLGDLNARKEKMNSDTTNSIAAARREAYARLAAKQELA
jgi:hypothetical protein